MDRMRESLFATLGNISGSSFLDLFSGSGVVGIEAASRGAEPVWLVEKDYKKRDTIEKNTSFVESDIYMRMMPVERFLRKIEKTFTYIFLDPPFSYREKWKLIELISENGLLHEEGVLLLHHPKEDFLPEAIGDLRQRKIKIYGRSILRFYSRNTE